MADAPDPEAPQATAQQPGVSSGSPAHQTATPPPTHQFRPSPIRSFTVSNPYLSSVKGRATSQPPGERQPNSTPTSGRGSPGMNGSGNDFGVIGGSRTPTGTGSGRAAQATSNAPPVTRASSFSVAEKMVDQRPSSLRTLSSHVEERTMDRSSSPFPTFSPSSSPSTSPKSGPGLQYSPPIAPANVSRSRSQSMATGVRPDRNFVVPMSTFDSPKTFKFDDDKWNDGSNMSPFSSSTRPFETLPNPKRSNTMAAGSYTQDVGAWKSPTTAALTSSVAKALGSQPSYSSVVGGFEDTANGGRSGTSSRRHSVSVVGGNVRRGFSFNDGFSSAGRRGIGALGFSNEELLPERFNNALSLSQVDAPQEEELASSLPIFTPNSEARSAARSIPPTSDPLFGSSPAGGGSKFNFERGRQSFSMQAGSSPEGASKAGAVGGPVRPSGPIGVPPMYDARFGAPPQAAFRPFGNALAPGPFNRPPAGFGYFGGIGQPPPAGRPPFPQNGAYGGGGGGGFGPPAPFGAQSYAPPSFLAPQPPNQPPTSPSSFSSLSLADLGKGIPLASLPPTTPLYIVTFKAGRRDVFYCPDPTLLISNGDRVIVEADRGSDLGTVVYDQLTPLDVREWQERQATAALLSGASQHQPPGMAMASGSPAPQQPPTQPPREQHARNGSHPVRPPAPGAADFTGADLNTLLSGVGPSGSQMDMGASGIGARGPLAKEIMPKRIFTKSSGGPEEQARMMEKLKDEYDAMMICREKVQQRGLPMQIVDAEYQWDRRKLTFYFKADKRVDFRELTKENFRIFKSRIWMSMVPKDDPRSG